jgi:hypothetical protein
MGTPKIKIGKPFTLTSFEELAHDGPRPARRRLEFRVNSCAR